ncbi:MAG: hypothetical protein JW719_01550 [Pirellulales bacterium]|nr:hypothetical protein [Pirellulales bacterium]
MFRSSYLLKFTSFVVGLAVLGIAAGAMAQTNWSNTVDSNWSNASNWDNGVPDSAQVAKIDCDIIWNVNHNPILDADGYALHLQVGENADSLLTIDANTLTVENNIYLGQSSGTTGTITQNGGTVNAVVLYGGSTEAGQAGAGNYTMTGGTLNIDYFSLGNHGTSTLTQSGGVVNNSVALWIGDNVYPGDVPSTPGGPGSATYILEGNAVYNGPTNPAYHHHLGPWGGYGVLTVQGDAVFNDTTLTVDLSSSTVAATGFINLHDDAQVNLTGFIRLASSSVTTGTLNQDGGTLTVPRIEKGAGAGTYNFTGGTLNVSEIGDMDLVNGGGRVNIGGTGAATNLVMDFSVSNNIALGKTATQSSYYWEAGWPASNGIDEVFNNMAHTNYEENAWWKVDLTGDDSNTSVHDMVLTARYDGYTHGTSNFWVRVIDKDGSTVLWEDTFITDPSELLDAGEKLWISLPSAVEGRYVQIQLDGYNLGDQVGYPNDIGFLAFTELQIGDVARYGYSQTSTSTLGIELDPDNELCDQLMVGELTLDGTLDVTALSTGFAAGQVFDILDWTSLTGTFSTVNLPSLTGSLGWDTSNLYVTGELAVVSTGTPIPGDTNNDQKVDSTDAATLADNWGLNVGTGGFAAGDFNDDQVVNAADAAILAANWGDHTVPPEGAAVPEPGICALFLTAVGLLAGARRRRHLN